MLHPNEVRFFTIEVIDGDPTLTGTAEMAEAIDEADTAPDDVRTRFFQTLAYQKYRQIDAILGPREAV